MVSSVLDMEADELLALLAQLARDHADDPDYRRWRAELPPEWLI